MGQQQVTIIIQKDDDKPQVIVDIRGKMDPIFIMAGLNQASMNMINRLSVNKFGAEIVPDGAPTNPLLQAIMDLLVKIQADKDAAAIRKPQQN